MKNTKKILLSLILVICVFAFTACGKNTDSNNLVGKWNYHGKVSDNWTYDMGYIFNADGTGITYMEQTDIPYVQHNITYTTDGDTLTITNIESDTIATYTFYFKENNTVLSLKEANTDEVLYNKVNN